MPYPKPFYTLFPSPTPIHAPHSTHYLLPQSLYPPSQHMSHFSHPTHVLLSYPCISHHNTYSSPLCPSLTCHLLQNMPHSYSPQYTCPTPPFFYPLVPSHTPTNTFPIPPTQHMPYSIIPFSPHSNPHTNTCPIPISLSPCICSLLALHVVLAFLVLLLFW